MKNNRHHKHNSSHGKEIILSAVVGGVLGAVAAALIAPKTRHLFKKESFFGDTLKSIIPEEQRTHYLGEKRNSGLANPLMLGGVAGTLLGAVTGLLLAPKPGSDVRHIISDTYQHVADITQDLVNNFNHKSQEIAQIASNRSADWATKALVMADSLVSEARNWADTVESAAHGAKAHAVKMKDDPEFQHKFGEIMEWAHKAENMAHGVSKEMREWAQSIRRAAEQVETNHVGSNALEEVMDWAVVGYDIWQKIKSKRS